MHWRLLCCFCLLGLTNWVTAIDTLYVCPGETVRLEAPAGRDGYLWTPATGLSSPNIFNPLISPTTDRIYTVESIEFGDNLIFNGDFEQGNTGFTSDHRYTAVATNDQQTYGIFRRPTSHNQAFGNCPDHTTGNGLLMTVDAATQPNQTAWCSEVTVNPNTTYIFSAWMTSVISTEPSVLSFNINGDQIGQTLNVSPVVCEWQQFYAEWNSGTATTATICLNNENLAPFGNDFALDDIFFAELENRFWDTIAVLIAPEFATLFDTFLCSNQSLNYLGQQFGPNTDTTFALTSTYGCDSIILLRIGLLDTIFQGFRIDTLCPGDTLFLNGQAFTQDTIVCNTVSSVDACDSTICTTIVFLTERALSIERQDPSCNNSADGSIAVDVQAGLPPYTYTWEDGSNAPNRNNLPEGVYRVTINDSKGCMAMTSIAIAAPFPLELEAIASPLTCSDDTNGIIQILPMGGTAPYEWSIDGSNYITTDQLGGLAVGDYLIQLRDANGCTTELITSISAPPPLLVDIQDSLELTLGSIQVLPSWTNGRMPVTYQWSSGVGLSCTDCPEPTLQATESGVYQLAVWDSAGCQATDSLLLTVIKNYQLYIPNVFSPNGDGTNDYFRLFPSQEVAGIRRFRVFDRWGGLLFESGDCIADDPLCHWNGERKGEAAPAGVYLYLFEVAFLDGTTKFFSGDVTLVR